MVKVNYIGDDFNLEAFELITNILAFFSTTFDHYEYDEVEEYDDILGLFFNYITNEEAGNALERLVDLTMNGTLTMDDVYKYIERYTHIDINTLDEVIQNNPKKALKYQELLQQIEINNDTWGGWA